jgi:hypothetical protein
MGLRLKFLNSYITSLQMRVGLFGGRTKRVEEQPLRAELFSIEQFKVYAKTLAQKHPVSYRRGQNQLLLR